MSELQYVFGNPRRGKAKKKVARKAKKKKTKHKRKSKRIKKRKTIMAKRKKSSKKRKSSKRGKRKSVKRKSIKSKRKASKKRSVKKRSVKKRSKRRKKSRRKNPIKVKVIAKSRKTRKKIASKSVGQWHQRSEVKLAESLIAKLMERARRTKNRKDKKKLMAQAKSYHKKLQKVKSKRKIKVSELRQLLKDIRSMGYIASKEEEYIPLKRRKKVAKKRRKSRRKKAGRKKVGRKRKSRKKSSRGKTKAKVRTSKKRISARISAKRPKGKGRSKSKTKKTKYGRYTVSVKKNPYFGGQADSSTKKFLGVGLNELTSLAIAGASQDILEKQMGGLIDRFLPQWRTWLGPLQAASGSLLSLTTASLIHSYVNPQLSGKGRAVMDSLTKAFVAASAVRLGAVIPQVATGMMSGVVYRPMSGVDYTPKSLSGINYTALSGGAPQMGVVPKGLSGYHSQGQMGHVAPQMGHGADFGQSDYGGGAGYTEAHKQSDSDFGDAEYGLDQSLG